MIYLDNAATTAVHPSVVAAIVPCYTAAYGYPGARHTAGRTARSVVDDARASVAGCLGCPPEGVVFTASGSEADNQALRTGVAWGEPRGRTRIVSTSIEHPAILQTLTELLVQGNPVTLVDPDEHGYVSPESIEAVLGPDVCLVSVMTVNNEVGTVQPVAAIAEAAHRAGALFHTDAVQAMGHVPVRMDEMGIDLLSLSAHKFHGPKGVGALACRPEALGGAPELPVPLVFGGGQEGGRRAGTENVPGIAGLACALREAVDDLPRYTAYVGELRDLLEAGLSDIPGAHVVGTGALRSPGTLCVCFEDIDRHELVAALDRMGVCASAGAACESGVRTASPVLTAMGVPEALANGQLRLSPCLDTSRTDVIAAIVAVHDAVAALREKNR